MSEDIKEKGKCSQYKVGTSWQELFWWKLLFQVSRLKTKKKTLPLSTSHNSETALQQRTVHEIDWMLSPLLFYPLHYLHCPHHLPPWIFTSSRSISNSHLKWNYKRVAKVLTSPALFTCHQSSTTNYCVL